MPNAQCPTPKDRADVVEGWKPGERFDGDLWAIALKDATTNATTPTPPRPRHHAHYPKHRRCPTTALSIWSDRGYAENVRML
ncbi:MAG: hypothetical protein ACYT04_62265, partial [Nostoc sp.]